MRQSTAAVPFALLGLMTLPLCAQEDAGFTQADADAITEMCGAPNDMLLVESGEQVRFEPPADLTYKATACVLNGVKGAGVIKLSFVGNEKYAEPESQ